jgi:hypothetical protein
MEVVIGLVPHENHSHGDTEDVPLHCCRDLCGLAD